VDEDFSLVRGLVQGYPKKLGRIGLTRSYRTGPAAAPVQAGTTLGGTLTAAGRRLAELTVTLERPDAVPALMTAPLAHSRVFPAWAAGGAEVDELVSGGSSDQRVTDVWSGPATLALLPSPVDELDALVPTEVLRGYRFEFSETITGGRLLDRTGR
jgi:acetoacetate decarboxylase